MSEAYSGGIPLNYPAFLAISNGTEQTAHVTITRYNGANASLVIDTEIAPRSLYKLDYTTSANIKTIENPRGLAGSVTEFGIHIRSDVGVTAYHMHDCGGSRDIFTLKGRQALGTLFYVPMQSDNIASSITPGNFGGYDQVDIVATENNTQVTVIPKARIRLATESNQLSPAGTSIIRTLQKGQTLKILEYEQDELPSLAGTRITATKPIAVTVTEDLVIGDTSGDQIVPVDNVASRYIVPRGYRAESNAFTYAPDRFYLTGTASGTEVEIYTQGSSPAATISLEVGQTERFDFPSASVNAIYVKANAPVYVYHRSGYGEEGAALLPGIYAIGQHWVSFFQATRVEYRAGFAVFRTGMHGAFRISYGNVNNATLNVGSPITVPNMPDWKVVRFDLPAAADGRVVTIENAQSPFSLGYITGHSSGNGVYGYLSSFNFEFPDTTYMCTTDPSVTLEGGYAMSYEWSYNGTPLPDETAQNITVTEPGAYTLEMNQDPKIVTLTTYVSRINAGTICPDTIICTGTAPNLSVSGASGDRFQWQTRSDVNAQWTDIAGATLPTYTPAPLTAITYYRRGTTANQCAMVYSESMEVKISPCVLPVNPHLMIRYE
jgi:hypothetical protein